MFAFSPWATWPDSKAFRIKDRRRPSRAPPRGAVRPIGNLGRTDCGQRRLSRGSLRPLDLTARFFRALGGPTRLKVLELHLGEGELSVSAMLRRLGIRQGRLSSHLACLRWCGCVTSEERGRFTYYRVTDRRVRGLVELAHRLAAEDAVYLATCTRIDPPPRRRRSRGARV